jgi:hypothetical protein
MVQRRTLKLKAKFESTSSYFSFKRRTQARSTQGQPVVNRGSTWDQTAPPYHGLALISRRLEPLLGVAPQVDNETKT